MNGPQTPSYPAINPEYDISVAFKAANLASSSNPNYNHSHSNSNSNRTPNFNSNSNSNSPQLDHNVTSPIKSAFTSPRLSTGSRPLSGIVSSPSASLSPVLHHEDFNNSNSPLRHSTSSPHHHRSSSQYSQHSQHSQHRGLGINGVTSDNDNNNIQQQPIFTNGNDIPHQRNVSSTSFQGAPIPPVASYKSQFDLNSQPKYQQIQPPLTPLTSQPIQMQPVSPVRQAPYSQKAEGGKNLGGDNEDLINHGIFSAKTAAQRDWQQRGAATLIETEKNAETGEVRTKIIKKGVTDFKFGRTLGEGSYSTVVAAVDRQTGKEYAIKVLDKRHIIKEKKVKYVNIEKNTLNRLGEHPGIVRLYYTFQDERSLYFVLDFASNGELLSLIKKLGTLDIECTRYYGAQLLDAVEFMHNNGVYHRDLKPENILLDDKMRIKITDFGTAKMIDSLKDSNGKDTDKYPSDIRTSSFVGTAEYVSPELLTEKATGKEADLWAFGCIIYQLIAGRPPFKAGNEYQTFQKIVKLQYSYSPGFPYLARDLIKRVLVLNPKDRYSIEQIKNHPFFEGINWDRKSLWKRPHPRLLPYRASAKTIVNPLKVPPTLSNRTGPTRPGHQHQQNHQQPQISPQEQRQVPKQQPQQAPKPQLQQAPQQQHQQALQQQQQKLPQQYGSSQNIVTPASAAIAALAKQPPTRKAAPPALNMSKSSGPNSGSSAVNSPAQNLSTTRNRSSPVATPVPSYPRQGSTGSPLIVSASPGAFTNSPVTSNAPRGRGSQGQIHSPIQTVRSPTTTSNIVLSPSGSGTGNGNKSSRVLAQLNTSSNGSRYDLTTAGRSSKGSGAFSGPTTSSSGNGNSYGSGSVSTPSPTTQAYPHLPSPTQSSAKRLDQLPLTQLDVDCANVLQHHNERILGLGTVYVVTTAANSHEEDGDGDNGDSKDNNGKDNHIKDNNHNRLSKFFSISKRKKRNLIVTTAARCLIVNHDDKKIRFEINLMAPGINIREYPFNKKTGYGSFSLETATKLFTIEDSRGTSEWLEILRKSRECGAQLLIKEENVNAVTAAAAAAASMNHGPNQTQNTTALSAATLAANISSSSNSNSNNHNSGNSNNGITGSNKQFGGKPSIASENSASSSLFLQRNEERKLLRRMKF
ncbi:kinase-like protein [Nadsonia fulvescens var. elongata DSM 6958]|uniref:non-specific serine/threonine protein kinase n=1 Tax=Nadsonia fulvescens var. elongata DSM 6958 TaxID=857566 RepID=A0A1E3PGW1_9ASCO|nr:kinase-like protein [Nadsonia fulvescens var. elongata DSM 6958]